VAISISMADKVGGGELSFGTSLMMVPWGVFGSERRLMRHFLDLDTFERVGRGADGEVFSGATGRSAMVRSWMGELSSWPRRLNMERLRRAMFCPQADGPEAMLTDGYGPDDINSWTLNYEWEAKRCFCK
jgi:hypothetical protein